MLTASALAYMSVLTLARARYPTSVIGSQESPNPRNWYTWKKPYIMTRVLVTKKEYTSMIFWNLSYGGGKHIRRLSTFPPASMPTKTYCSCNQDKIIQDKKYEKEHVYLLVFTKSLLKGGENPYITWHIPIIYHHLQGGKNLLTSLPLKTCLLSSPPHTQHTNPIFPYQEQLWPLEILSPEQLWRNDTEGSAGLHMGLPFMHGNYMMSTS